MVCLITRAPKGTGLAAASLSLSKTCQLIKTDAMLAWIMLFGAIGQQLGAFRTMDRGWKYY